MPDTVSDPPPAPAPVPGPAGAPGSGLALWQIDCDPAATALRPAQPVPFDPVRHLPRILTHTTAAWRHSCLTATARIPAGFTYVAQLMGHDMGDSVGLDTIPHVPALADRAPDRKRPATRYNMIENPLTLETVYGAGPKLLGHLYDPVSRLFRLTPGHVKLARVYPGLPGLDGNAAGTPIRALYDERNRDTLMLHELTVAWMQFHNRCARQLMAAGAEPFAAYALARAHAVRVWHALITDELLPRFLHPDIATLPPGRLVRLWNLNETTLLHGLFRAFHALPLAAYPMEHGAPQPLRRLMKAGIAPSHAEQVGWRIPWAAFLGAAPGGPMTGLSASVAPELRMGQAIAAMDFATVRDTFPMRLGNPAIRRAVDALDTALPEGMPPDPALGPGPWSARLAPARLALDFRARHPDAPDPPDAEVLTHGPLYLALLVEAQLYGQGGGFGPFGSALLRSSVLGSIERVRLAPETPATDALPRPATILDLITLAREI